MPVRSHTLHRAHRPRRVQGTRPGGLTRFLKSAIRWYDDHSQPDDPGKSFATAREVREFYEGEGRGHISRMRQDNNFLLPSATLRKQAQKPKQKPRMAKPTKKGKKGGK